MAALATQSERILDLLSAAYYTRGGPAPPPPKKREYICNAAPQKPGDGGRPEFYLCEKATAENWKYALANGLIVEVSTTFPEFTDSLRLSSKLNAPVKMAGAGKCPLRFD